MIRFLVDECTGPTVARWLTAEGFDVASVFEQARGIDDEGVLRLAVDQDRVLITNDKDFGEKVHREGRPHRGVILLRLADERSVVKIQVLKTLLQAHSKRLKDRFTVVTEQQVRFAK